MIATWKRVQVLVLLVCGLATAPFGSLEQIDTADMHNGTMLCLSGAGPAPPAFHASNWRADLAVHPVTPAIEWPLTISQAEWRQAAAVLRFANAPELTYHANAPPAHLI